MYAKLLVLLCVSAFAATPAFALHDENYNNQPPDGTYVCEAPGPDKHVEITGGGIFLIYGGEYIYTWNPENARYELDHPEGGTNYFEFNTDEYGIGEYNHGYNDSGIGGGSGVYSSGSCNPTA